jgi:hypothetical protein
MKGHLEGTNEWALRFFDKDIFILGLGLDYSKLDLWWLITYRSQQIRMRNLGIKNRITYFDLEGKHGDPVKIEMLKAFHVNVIECVGQGYKQKYNWALQYIKKSL